MKSFLQWFLSWGIRKKLFVLVVSTTVLTAGAVSILDYINVSLKLIETTGEKLSVISENASKLIVRQIHNEIDLIRFMATSDTILTAVEEANLINLADTSTEIEQAVTLSGSKLVAEETRITGIDQPNNGSACKSLPT